MGMIKGVSDFHFRRRTKVFDITSKTLLGVFESGCDAAKFAGVKKASVASYVRTKSRCHKNKFNKPIAFR